VRSKAVAPMPWWNRRAAPATLRKKHKNVLSLRMGPFRTPPYWDRLKFNSGCPGGCQEIIGVESGVPQELIRAAMPAIGAGLKTTLSTLPRLRPNSAG